MTKISILIYFILLIQLNKIDSILLFVTIELTLIKLINKIDRVNELWKTSLNLDITRLQINF